MMKFSVGQRVRFEPPGRGTGGGEQWNVAPALLRPAVVAADAVEIVDTLPHKDRP